MAPEHPPADTADATALAKAWAWERPRMHALAIAAPAASGGAQTSAWPSAWLTAVGLYKGSKKA